MATSVPEPIKAADLGRFATRAAQLEKFKPVISYWCEYSHTWPQSYLLTRVRRYLVYCREHHQTGLGEDK